MEILELMSRAREGHAVGRLGAHFELSDSAMERVLNQTIPMLEDALTRLMAHPQGLASILAQLASGQYQRDLQARDIFQDQRILANGTGVLSLLLRNEATIRIIAFVVAEGSKVDAMIIRRMMPYIAIIYLSALAKRSNEPLRELAARFTSAPFDNGRGTYRLAELVLSKSPTKKISPRPLSQKGSIRDILDTLTKGDMDEDVDAPYLM